MPFDGLFLTSIVSELKDEIIGGKINKIYQGNGQQIFFKIRQQNQTHNLLISANPVQARIHLTEFLPERPKNPPVFCMVLRKHLEGGKIQDILQKGSERVLKIIIVNRDEIGEKITRHLYIEIMGKHSNIILTNAVDKILDSIKKISSSMSRKREILPGLNYQAPPQQEKIAIFDLETEEQLSKIILSEDLDSTLWQALIAKLQGLAPSTAKFLIKKADLPENIFLETAGTYEFTKLWQSIHELKKMFLENRFQPVVWFQNGKPADYYFLPLTESVDIKNYQKCFQAIDQFYQIKNKSDRLNQVRMELTRIIEKELQKTNKKIKIQEKDLLHNQNYEKFKIWGELLTANLYQLQNGIEKATVADFYHNNELLTISLDKSLSINQNAQKYFKKYNKSKQAIIQINKQLDANQSEKNYLDSILVALGSCTDLEDTNEIKKELEENGYIKIKTHKKQLKKIESKPLIWQSPAGYTVFIGKNNRQNDQLTLKKAEKNDLWFHTKDIPGSHVIVQKNQNNDYSDEIIIKAAQLAAYYSKAKNAAKVPVDYTLVSQVKKPKGAKPGMVIYFKQKTVFVQPLDLLRI